MRDGRRWVRVLWLAALVFVPAVGSQPYYPQGVAFKPYPPEPGPYPKAVDGREYLPEPTNLLQGVQPGPSAEAYNTPRMPPYAWPTYAPYNNFSRVATPLLYPYQAWPFIGPVYPFPKVPTGWRTVTLTWQDAPWWYGKNTNGTRWWVLRYQ